VGEQKIQYQRGEITKMGSPQTRSNGPKILGGRRPPFGRPCAMCGDSSGGVLMMLAQSDLCIAPPPPPVLVRWGPTPVLVFTRRRSFFLRRERVFRFTKFCERPKKRDQPPPQFLNSSGQIMVPFLPPPRAPLVLQTSCFSDKHWPGRGVKPGPQQAGGPLKIFFSVRFLPPPDCHGVTPAHPFFPRHRAPPAETTKKPEFSEERPPQRWPNEAPPFA